MAQNKSVQPRRVVARRISTLGGLAALSAAGAIAPDLAAAGDLRNDGTYLLAQAEGEGEGEASAGGEGEGEGASSLDPDIAFLSGLSFIEGHICAGLALYEAGDLEAARTHVGHPIEEKYDAVAEELEEQGLSRLRGEIEALAAAAEARADYAELEALFAKVRATHEEARANYTPAQQVAGLVALTRTAGDEYTVAVKGGEVSNLHEYQDSWGFLRVVETEAGQMTDSDDPAVADVAAALLEQVAATEAAYGDIQGEGDFEMDPSIIYGAAARMELAALELDAGEGEGEASAGSEGEGKASVGGEGESQ
ncbi:hypothetical protein [Roseovarius indicus]|uniref:Uncharacterized protein n=1 Tax=Roseovarius indicus TaxID=540747 RepID=A0A5P3AML5_9RHOB|nr:hypothetical protein [Roseovarius indicus]QEW29920.1 hypothetical protein RIdsm_05766 [Roseovarius indicus]SFE82095.1 hypothetical protein SAMN04488031_12428 [Roseovarius indicus]